MTLHHMLRSSVGSAVLSDYWITQLESGTAVGNGIAVDASGNVYVVGAVSNDALIVKYNNLGVVQWQKTLGGAAADIAFNVTIGPTGSIYVVGTTSSQGAGQGDAFIAKYDSNGNVQWQRTLGRTQNDGGRSLAVDPSDNVYIVLNPAARGVVAKYDSSGTLLWQRGTSSATIQDIAVDASGNSYLACTTIDDGINIYGAALIKYDTSGTVQWQKTLGTSTGGSSANAVALDTSGNIHLVGSLTHSTNGGSDILYAKYNSSGTLLSQTRLGRTDNDYGKDVAVDASGNVYILGESPYQSVVGNDLIIVKINSSGSVSWQRRLGTSFSDVALRIAIDSLSNFYIVGNASNLTVFKLPGSGSLTGTYGIFTYAAVSLVISGSDLVDLYITFNGGTTSFIANTSTLSSNTATLSSIRTNV